MLLRGAFKRMVRRGREKESIEELTTNGSVPLLLRFDDVVSLPSLGSGTVEASIEKARTFSEDSLNEGSAFSEDVFSCGDRWTMLGTAAEEVVRRALADRATLCIRLPLDRVMPWDIEQKVRKNSLCYL